VAKDAGHAARQCQVSVERTKRVVQRGVWRREPWVPPRTSQYTRVLLEDLVTPRSELLNVKEYVAEMRAADARGTIHKQRNTSAIPEGSARLEKTNSSLKRPAYIRFGYAVQQFMREQLLRLLAWLPAPRNRWEVEAVGSDSRQPARARTGSKS